MLCREIIEGHQGLLFFNQAVSGFRKFRLIHVNKMLQDFEGFIFAGSHPNLIVSSDDLCSAEFLARQGRCPSESPDFDENHDKPLADLHARVDRTDIPP